MTPDIPPRSGIWKRFLLGALMVIVASASATAVAAFREVDRVVAVLNEASTLELGGEIAEADAGKPQTIMLIGSDKRAAGAIDAGGARSDTVILVRLDPEREATALMSLPRDLKVQIPGHGTRKLNEAYALGGPRLTLRTVKRLTGLSVNHVINVDFGGFRRGVDRIGGVYVDIDRRYFNQNTGPGGYAAIDVPEGYQKLKGQDALDYVRFRHTDNDIVRSARQQDFLRAAKQQVGVSELIADRTELFRIFARYAESDIRSKAAVLRLLKLVVGVAGKKVREVHFEGNLGASYVTASSSRVKRLADQFLGVEETKGPRGRQSKSRRRKPKGLGLVDYSKSGREVALQAISAGATVPIFYPRMLTAGATLKRPPRVYGLREPRGRVHNSYRFVVERRGQNGGFSEYYGIQGTTWKEPPILSDPSETRQVKGRKLELHFDGDRLRLVAWRARGGVYWVSNTLLQTLSERQMLAIASSARSLSDPR